jgi:hypothetical protein
MAAIRLVLGRTMQAIFEAQQATEKSVRNAQTVMESATAVSKGMNEISREYFQLAQHQMKNSIDRMNQQLFASLLGGAPNLLGDTARL